MVLKKQSNSFPDTILDRLSMLRSCDLNRGPCLQENTVMTQEISSVMGRKMSLGAS